MTKTPTTAERAQRLADECKQQVRDLYGETQSLGHPLCGSMQRRQAAEALEETITAIDQLAALAAAPQAQQALANEIPIPQNADQACGMVLCGVAWLREHAPERLKAQQAPVKTDNLPDDYEVN